MSIVLPQRNQDQFVEPDYTQLSNDKPDILNSFDIDVSETTKYSTLFARDQHN